ncbi:MAG: hypothetical protein CMB80_23595 [Flammeovirgaceae bacterium]|nr:hypothetical protein [Flammeovirgaceae bacterium]MBE63417.1 hypothetical protein [Flammeovirgaceae bacterium]HCX22826.1 hypothetical protein [Cytophagales bacterium]
MSVIFRTGDDISRIQNKIIDQIIVITSLLGGVVIALSLLGVILFGPRTTSLVHASVFALVLVLNFSKNRFPPVPKLILLLVLLQSDILYSVYHDGYISSAKIVMTILPVFVSFICKVRKAIVFLIFMLAAHLIMGYFHIVGVFQPGLNLTAYSSEPFAWIMDCAIIAFSSLGLMYVAKTYNEAILENSLLIKAQNEEIINREKKYEILFQSSNDAILLIQGLEIVDCNEKTLDLFKSTREELIGRKISDLSPEKQPDGQVSTEKAEKIVESIYNGLESKAFDWVHVKSNEEVFYASVSIKLVKLHNNRYIQSVVRDITREKEIEMELIAYQDQLKHILDDRTEELEETNQQLSQTNEELKQTLEQLKQTQAHLIESEKMASVGILTAGISHEINNPLNCILGGLYKLKDTVANPQDYVEDEDIDEVRGETIEIIDDGVTRIRDIVKSLNHFNRVNDELLQPCNVHAVIENCLRILKYELHGQVVSKDFNSDELMILGNDGKLHQVFLNLIHNADQSTDQSGEITLSTRLSDDGKRGVISVKDTGSGITAEDLPHVFDPFFTTKPPGEGVGLGLFIVYQIIKEHHGEITIRSNENGTEVLLELPLAV